MLVDMTAADAAFSLRVFGGLRFGVFTGIIAEVLDRKQVLPLMIVEKIVEYFAPAECLGCGSRQDFICQGCIEQLPRALPECYVCRKSNNTGRSCESCHDKSVLSKLWIATDYDGMIREALLTLKNRRARSISKAFGDLLAKNVVGDSSMIDLVTWVPVSPIRRRERGYNQAELIGRRVAEQLGLPACSTLGRVTSLHQTGADRDRRLAQVSGAFYPTRRLDGRRVLLVDDVVTTGATMDECARMLLAAGASEVVGAAVARHLSKTL